MNCKQLPFQLLGNADAILFQARATSEGLLTVSKSLTAQKGMDAAGLRIAEQYVEVCNLSSSMAVISIWLSFVESCIFIGFPGDCKI